MDDGTEIRLFDPRRNPQDWTDVVRPTACAVLLKDRTTSTSVGPGGQPFPKPADTTCIVFGRLDAAQQYCEMKVQALPHLRCEIYDAEGLAHPPLLVIVNSDFEHEEEAGSSGSRRRKLIAGILTLVSIPLFWLGTRQYNSSDLFTFLAINCIFIALRFLYWDSGLKHGERERRRRVEAHRRRERGDA